MRDEEKTQEELLAELAQLRDQLNELSPLKTELQACRKELSEIEMRYRLVTENANDIIWLWDIKAGHFVYISPSVRRLRGYTVEEVMEQTLYNSLPPQYHWLLNDELKHRVNILESGNESARLKSYEMEQTHKDGSLLSTEVSTTLITDAQGRVTHMQGITRDISERKAAQAKLEENERQLRAILEACTESIFLIDRHGQIIFANETTAQRLGRGHEDLHQKNIASLVAPETVERRANFVQQVLATGKPLRFEDKREDHYYINSLYPITDEQGETTHLAIFSMDITELKTTEISLRESEERYRNMFEKNNAVMLLIDSHDGTIIDANRRACEFYGWPHETMLTFKISDINILTKEEVHEEMERARAQKRTHFFFKHRRADGSIRDVEVFSGPMYFKERELLYSIIYDITEHKLMEEELIKARKLESVGVLAGGIAHDFNNLLAAIQGYIELSRMDIHPEHPTQKKLAAAQDAVVQATDLTKELITFSKGGAPLPKPCDLTALVHARIRKMQVPSNIKIAVQADDSLWPAEVDQGQLSQVVANITENAIEAMPAGGTMRIHLENVNIARQDILPIAEGQYVRITISDTGSGIAETDMPHIFDPYYSTKQRGKQKGMGLGLAVCHSIVNRHKGCIQAYSGVGKGCTIQIHIPRSALGKPMEMAHPSPAETRTASKIKILLMDDEFPVRDMTSALLSALGYEVTAAADGLEAITLYTQAIQHGVPFDMLLLDLTVKGGMGGVLALERILETDPKAKAIVFSGYTDDPVIENYRDYGFLDAITKPFTAETLKMIIEKHH